MALLAAGACADDPRATDTTTLTARPAAASDTAGPDPTIDYAELCVHTDPMKRPITVHRAVHCPDGTAVSVQGVMIHGADGSTLLCDAVSEVAPATCAGDQLTVRGGERIGGSGSVGGPIGYTGTVSGGVLTIAQLLVFDTVPTLAEVVPTT